ncbi:MAG: GTP cyclohydrolase I FolE [Spirochaetes bacterium]|nr:GTP cyclohydrolase I FolE [Spirochaetota bacterium]
MESKIDKKRIENAMKEIIQGLGLDIHSPNLTDTPRRVADMYEEIFAGIGEDPSKLIKKFKTDNYQEIIMVKDIPLYSMCEHHFIPFIGKAHVGYIPQKGVFTGLSKIARIVDIASKKPQLQERLTQEIADAMVKKLEPLGVIVVIEAEHLCMSMRGIKKPGTLTVTSALRGVFIQKEDTRLEAMNLIFGTSKR